MVMNSRGMSCARGEYKQAAEAYALASGKGGSASLAQKLYQSRTQTGSPTRPGRPSGMA